MLSANPKFACTGERIIQKTPRIWAGGNSTRLFTNPLTASPLAFSASQPKQMHSREKCRQLRRLTPGFWYSAAKIVESDIWYCVFHACLGNFIVHSPSRKREIPPQRLVLCYICYMLKPCARLARARQGPDTLYCGLNISVCYRMKNRSWT